MAVHLDGVPPESAPTGIVSIHIMLEHCGIALAKAIDVNDGAQIVELEVPG